MSGSSLKDRLLSPGPKRLLALDGGGLRGLISLGFLEEVEQTLRRRHGRDDLVLSDYFDLIGGTSTGAILATALALGSPVSEIHRLYLSLGQEAFQPRKTWLGPLGRTFGARYDEQPLKDLLREHLGDRTLGSPDLRTGLLVVAKRADTGSVWPLVNIPTQKYYEANRDFSLWEVVASSAAAPTVYRPHLIDDVGSGEKAVFVDGGMSMHVSPALQVLMAASLEGFGLNWPLGEDRMLLCSVGTGSFEPKLPPEVLADYGNLKWLAVLTWQMMRDATELNRTMLQWMSRSPTAEAIDGQIEDLGGDLLGERPLLSYLRYEASLDKDALAELGFAFGDEEIKSIRNMTKVENLERWHEIGRRAATKSVDVDHFPGVFDLDRP